MREASHQKSRQSLYVTNPTINPRLLFKNCPQILVHNFGTNLELILLEILLYPAKKKIVMQLHNIMRRTKYQKDLQRLHNIYEDSVDSRYIFHAR